MHGFTTLLLDGRLQDILPRLPDDARTELGPDASGLGWIFQYALVDASGRHSLAELRSYQDWFLRYQLAKAQGVAEVASVGGFVRGPITAITLKIRVFCPYTVIIECCPCAMVGIARGLIRVTLLVAP